MGAINTITRRDNNLIWCDTFIEEDHGRKWEDANETASHSLWGCNMHDYCILKMKAAAVVGGIQYVTLPVYGY